METDCATTKGFEPVDCFVLQPEKVPASGPAVAVVVTPEHVPQLDDEAGGCCDTNILLVLEAKEGFPFPLDAKLLFGVVAKGDAFVVNPTFPLLLLLLNRGDDCVGLWLPPPPNPEKFVLVALVAPNVILLLLLLLPKAGHPVVVVCCPKMAILWLSLFQFYQCLCLSSGLLWEVCLFPLRISKNCLDSKMNMHVWRGMCRVWNPGLEHEPRRSNCLR